jgi:hypothetical protein
MFIKVVRNFKNYDRDQKFLVIIWIAGYIIIWSLFVCLLFFNYFTKWQLIRLILIFILILIYKLVYKFCLYWFSLVRLKKNKNFKYYKKFGYWYLKKIFIKSNLVLYWYNKYFYLNLEIIRNINYYFYNFLFIRKIIIYFLILNKYFISRIFYLNYRFINSIQYRWFFSIITFRIYGLIIFIFIFLNFIKNIYIYWCILFIFVIIFYFLDFLPNFIKKRIFREDIFFWRVDDYLQTLRLRRLYTIQGSLLTNIFFFVEEKTNYVCLLEYYFYGRNYVIIDMLDSNLKLDNINFLLNEIKHKPSIIFLDKLLEYKFTSILYVLNWLKFYFSNLDEKLRYNYFKELRNLKLYFKILWDYEYYFLGKAEARLGITSSWIYDAIPITPFFNLWDNKDLPPFCIKKELLNVKKNDKDVRDIDIRNNNDSYLLHHIYMHNDSALKYVSKKLFYDFNTSYNDGILYLSAKKKDKKIYDKERKKLNSIFWDNSVFFGEMIEELREEWYKELKNNKREFYKINRVEKNIKFYIINYLLFSLLLCVYIYIFKWFVFIWIFLFFG